MARAMLQMMSFSRPIFSFLLTSRATTTKISASASDSLVMLCWFMFSVSCGVMLQCDDVFSMTDFVAVMAHPQHRKLLFCHQTGDNLIHILFVVFIQRAGDFVQQQH